MASDIETVARPYAEAAYGYASEQDEVGEWEKMLGFAAAVSEDSRVAPLINGTLPADELAAAFCGLLGYDVAKEKKTGEPAIDGHCANYLRVMAENGRLSLMPEVFRQFEERAEKDRNVLSVEVVSASELSKANLAKIKKIAEKHWHCKAKLSTAVDAALIGGFIIRAGNEVVDMSLKSRLGSLASALKA